MSDDLRFREYLGDSVYAAIDPYGAVVLTTENGFRPTNTIVLEPEVLDALERWLRELRKSRGAK